MSNDLEKSTFEKKINLMIVTHYLQFLEILIAYCIHLIYLYFQNHLYLML